MINKGFVDLLFILLCGAIVMLAQSVRLGSIPSQPADAGAGASRVDGEETVVMVVGSDWVALEGRRFPGVFEASGAMGGGDVVVVPADREVAHHRMVAVWNSITETGRIARFGVIAGAMTTGDES